MKHRATTRRCLTVKSTVKAVDRITDVASYAAIGTLSLMGAGVVAGGTIAIGLPAAGLGTVVGVACYAKAIYKIVKE